MYPYITKELDDLIGNHDLQTFNFLLIIITAISHSIIV